MVMEDLNINRRWRNSRRWAGQGHGVNNVTSPTECSWKSVTHVTWRVIVYFMARRLVSVHWLFWSFLVESRCLSYCTSPQRLMFERLGYDLSTVCWCIDSRRPHGPYTVTRLSLLSSEHFHRPFRRLRVMTEQRKYLRRLLLVLNGGSSVWVLDAGNVLSNDCCSCARQQTLESKAGYSPKATLTQVRQLVHACTEDRLSSGDEEKSFSSPESSTSPAES